MCTNCHLQPIETKSQDSQVEDELDNIILELVHAGSRLPAGKTVNAGMFPEAKASLRRLVLRERKDELKEVQLAPMSNPSTLNDDNELPKIVFTNEAPEDKEWTARIKLLNEYCMPVLYLREITQYARSGPFYPADMHVHLIEQIIHQRDEARDRQIAMLKSDIAYAIGRFQGMEMDSAYLEQRYPEWKQLTNTEKGNSNEQTK